jgi:hypothetical protein
MSAGIIDSPSAYCFGLESQLTFAERGAQYQDEVEKKIKKKRQ